MKTIEPCLNCKHLLEFGCKAYPDGIPDKYAQGLKIHNSIQKDQQGDFIFDDVNIEIENLYKDFLDSQK